MNDQVAAQPRVAALGADQGRFLTVARQYHFEAGHFLPNVHDGHKCKRQHGHNYRIEVVLTGPVENTGFVIDFWDMDRIVKPFIDQVDHRNLNDIEGLENPTAENITGWFFDNIEESLHHSGSPIVLVSLTVWEVDSSYAKLEVGTPQQSLMVINQLSTLLAAEKQKNGTLADPKATGSRINPEDLRNQSNRAESDPL